VSADKGLKYYNVYYLRHHNIRILKGETKTIQMRPNLAGYTSGRGWSKILGPCHWPMGRRQSRDAFLHFIHRDVQLAY